MKLTFLGTGAAFAYDNFHSNALLELDGKRLLIDCGGDIRHAVHRIGLGHRDIDAVYISHLHADHIGGMEWLALTTHFDPTAHRPQLYINERLVAPLWESMRAGAGTLQNEITGLATYFEINPLGRNAEFEYGRTVFRTVQTIHYMDGFDIVPSYGLLWRAPDGRRVFFTTDTMFAPHQLMSFYESVDVIFHDCETARTKSGVHAHYSDLRTLAPDVKKKMWLYHYQDGPKPDALADGFAGFVAQGQVFDFSAAPTKTQPAGAR